MLFGANEPDEDGERVWDVCVLCSDLIDDGVWDFIECASPPTRRPNDGGVVAPPVIDDELDSSSLSLSYGLCVGDLSIGTFP